MTKILKTSTKITHKKQLKINRLKKLEEKMKTNMKKRKLNNKKLQNG
jgi:hypothetical protein